MTRRYCALLCCALASHLASADSLVPTPHPSLVTVYRGSRVIAAEPFYRKLAQVPMTSTVAAQALQNDMAARGRITTPVSPQSLFPITSAGLGPGAPREITVAQLYRPFFFIGMDSSSIAWLRTHYSRLEDIGAFGLVVEAHNWRDWLQLRGEAARAGITLSLLPGDALAGIYGIATYPTLVRGSR